MKCANECPCNAISFGDKIMYNGYEMWKPDVEKCTLYRVTNPKGASCGRCMKMCPFNKEGLFAHRAALWAAIKIPFLRKFLARADDWFEYGKRMAKNKWWWDHENVDGEYKIAKAAHERDLKKDYRPRGEDRYAIFPPETMPPPGTKDPFPIDRAQGVKDRATAEKPPENGS